MPLPDAEHIEMTLVEALTLLKSDPERVMTALDDMERRSVTDDVIRLLSVMSVVVDPAHKKGPKDVLVLMLTPTKADLVSLSEDEAIALVNRFNRGGDA